MSDLEGVPYSQGGIIPGDATTLTHKFEEGELLFFGDGRVFRFTAVEGGFRWVPLQGDGE